VIEYSLRQNPIHRSLVEKSEAEARREVALLALAGHLAPRGVIDVYYEFAYTCDACGLWGYVSHKVDGDIHSEEERAGAVFTEKCEPDAIVKKFGFFNPNYALSREQTPFAPATEQEAERIRYKKRMTPQSRERARLYAKFRRAEKRRDNEATAEEFGG
jgi:hypothetical protein